MDAIRRRLRTAAALWLICQTVSLAAFVPVDCCANHREARHAQADHSAETASDASCHRVPEPPQDECRMTGMCDGPGQALLGVFAYNGIVSERSPFHPDLRAADAMPSASASSRALVTPPDAPPPRA